MGGRSGTDGTGHHWFSTLPPRPTRAGAAPFFAVTVFAGGLLNRLFTRCYLPDNDSLLYSDKLLSGLDPVERAGLVATREGDGSLRFDIHLQGPRDSVADLPRARLTMPSLLEPGSSRGSVVDDAALVAAMLRVEVGWMRALEGGGAATAEQVANVEKAAATIPPTLRPPKSKLRATRCCRWCGRCVPTRTPPRSSIGD
jgi:hypothetical protein